MALADFQAILTEAYANKFAIGCFEVWDQYSMEAVVEAAEELNAPVIIGFGSLSVNRDWLDAGGLEAMGALGSEIARRASVPVSLFMNEAHSYAQVVRAIMAGFNAVFLASWELPFDDNVQVTREVVKTAHAVGVAVEGEVGALSADTKSEFTDPELAAEFVRLTEIDALAISIGNVRYSATGSIAVDLELLDQIRSKVAIPLVIHGGTGFPRDAVRQATQKGIAKFNVGTSLKKAFFEGMQRSLTGKASIAETASHLGRRDEADALIQGKLALKRRVIEFIKLYRGEE